jgi:hypothetical protein
MAETWGEMARAWPYSTFLIVLNEFCQKFASLSSWNLSVFMGKL